jgi:bidirectional [NiFe] hydrogenase diaphorase subunit
VTGPESPRERRRNGDGEISLRVDGVATSVPAGASVMQAAAAAGVKVPGLCALEGLSHVGSCRLCMVEIDGSPRLRPACATPVAESMDVHTCTPRLLELRRALLEMLFAEGQHICAVCVASGACELQTLAAEYGVDHARFAPPPERMFVDLSHPRFGYDASRCILCTRCVRACAEVEGAFTLALAGRGRGSFVITDLGGSWGEAETCTTCGKCVNACPVGALFEKGTGVATRTVDSDLIATLVARRAREANREGSA